jgi:hypothetical protein
MKTFHSYCLMVVFGSAACFYYVCANTRSFASEDQEILSENTLVYHNNIVKNNKPLPILSKYPEFVARILNPNRFLAPPLVVDENPTLLVRSWRYSYNARGIIEVENKLDGKHTAVIVVHPWGIDDGQGFMTPEPAGVVFLGTPRKNAIYQKHLRTVLNPFLKKMRPHVAFIGYTLPGKKDKYQGKSGIQRDLDFTGQPVLDIVNLTKGKEVFTYFENFKGRDTSSRYHPEGFWDLPIPLARSLTTAPGDEIFYDGEGEHKFISDLRERGITNVLIAGYATDRCLRSSPCGYDNLRSQFNVFIVGDATLATFPALKSPRKATTVALANASVNNFITEISWIKLMEDKG